MRADELRAILKAKPFEPVLIGLSDGRSVLVRHPDLVVVSERKVYIGLAKLKRTAPLATPDNDETLTRDFIWVSLLHVVSAEPAEDAA